MDRRYPRPRQRRPYYEVEDEAEESQSTKPPESMSSWLQRQTSSHQAQLAATAVLSGAAVAGTILGIQAIRRRVAVEDLKASIPDIDDRHAQNVGFSISLTEYGTASPVTLSSKEDERSAALAARASRGDYNDDLILEQLARNRVFLTDAGLSKLRSSFIIIVGCGGVGSHAAAALARSGVSRIRLIDFDQVTLSSLNRHAVATLADVGTPKVHCIRKRLEQIAPWVKFDCRNELFSSAAAEEQLGPWDTDMGQNPEKMKPDYIIDCIDNIGSKVNLLHYCHRHSLHIISSMGAACKSDPTRVVIGDISLSAEDPLSRSTRRRLKALGVHSGIPVVFSTEKPGPGKAALLPLPQEEFEKGEVGELGVLPDFRVRILPVLGTMPAVFGYAAANHVICEVTGYPNEYNPGGKGREKMYEGMLAALQGMEERLAKSEQGHDPIGLRIPVSRDDVAYLVEEVWRGKSVVSGLPTRLALLRWERPHGGFGADRMWEKEGQRFVRMDLRDLVCMTKEESQRHEREILLGRKNVEDVYEESILKIVQERRMEQRAFEKFR